MIRFDGRVAIVTGAGAGIGREYALLLAARGAKVVVNDLGAAPDGSGSNSTLPAEAVASEIREAGGEAIANTDSVADLQGAHSIVSTAVQTWGRLDILINNAGILREGRFDEMDDQAIHALMGVHLLGPIYCVRAALPVMLKQQYGRIVLTSSGSGMLGRAGHSIYGTTKTAMLGLMNCLNLDYKSTGVLVNTIVPSAETRISKGLVQPEVARHMSPRLIAPMLAYLASEHCTQTGEVINAFGGYFFKASLLQSPGVQFDPQSEITPEMIEQAWPRIVDMSEPMPYRGTIASLEPNLRKLGRL